jgi:hypothetical protein
MAGDSDLADRIRQFRDRLDDRVCPDEDHLDQVVSAKDVRDDLDTILDDADAQHPGLELVVEFRQQFTVKPPDDYTDPVSAEDWFWNIYPDMGRDVVDTRSKDHYEVVAVRPRGNGWS